MALLQLVVCLTWCLGTFCVTLLVTRTVRPGPWQKGAQVSSPPRAQPPRFLRNKRGMRGVKRSLAASIAFLEKLRKQLRDASMRGNVIGLTAAASRLEEGMAMCAPVLAATEEGQWKLRSLEDYVGTSRALKVVLLKESSEISGPTRGNSNINHAYHAIQAFKAVHAAMEGLYTIMGSGCADVGLGASEEAIRELDRLRRRITTSFSSNPQAAPYVKRVNDLVADFHSWEESNIQLQASASMGCLRDMLGTVDGAASPGREGNSHYHSLFSRFLGEATPAPECSNTAKHSPAKGLPQQARLQPCIQHLRNCKERLQSRHRTPQASQLATHIEEFLNGNGGLIRCWDLLSESRILRAEAQRSIDWVLKIHSEMAGPTRTTPQAALSPSTLLSSPDSFPPMPLHHVKRLQSDPPTAWVQRLQKQWESLGTEFKDIPDAQRESMLVETTQLYSLASDLLYRIEACWLNGLTGQFCQLLQDSCKQAKLSDLLVAQAELITICEYISKHHTVSCKRSLSNAYSVLVQAREDACVLSVHQHLSAVMNLILSSEPTRVSAPAPIFGAALEAEILSAKVARPLSPLNMLNTSPQQLNFWDLESFIVFYTSTSPVPKLHLFSSLPYPRRPHFDSPNVSPPKVAFEATVTSPQADQVHMDGQNSGGPTASLPEPVNRTSERLMGILSGLPALQEFVGKDGCQKDTALQHLSTIVAMLQDEFPGNHHILDFQEYFRKAMPVLANAVSRWEQGLIADSLNEECFAMSSILRNSIASGKVKEALSMLGMLEDLAQGLATSDPNYPAADLWQGVLVDLKVLLEGDLGRKVSSKKDWVSSHSDEIQKLCKKSEHLQNRIVESYFAVDPTACDLHIRELEKLASTMIKQDLISDARCSSALQEADRTIAIIGSALKPYLMFSRVMKTCKHFNNALNNLLKCTTQTESKSVLIEQVLPVIKATSALADQTRGHSAMPLLMRACQRRSTELLKYVSRKGQLEQDMLRQLMALIFSVEESVTYLMSQYPVNQEVWNSVGEAAHALGSVWEELGTDMAAWKMNHSLSDAKAVAFSFEDLFSDIYYCVFPLDKASEGLEASLAVRASSAAAAQTHRVCSTAQILLAAAQNPMSLSVQQDTTARRQSCVTFASVFSGSSLRDIMSPHASAAAGRRQSCVSGLLSIFSGDSMLGDSSEHGLRSARRMSLALGGAMVSPSASSPHTSKFPADVRRVDSFGPENTQPIVKFDDALDGDISSISRSSAGSDSDTDGSQAYITLQQPLVEAEVTSLMEYAFCFGCLASSHLESPSPNLELTLHYLNEMSMSVSTMHQRYCDHSLTLASLEWYRALEKDLSTKHFDGVAMLSTKLSYLKCGWNTHLLRCMYPHCGGGVVLPLIKAIEAERGRLSSLLAAGSQAGSHRPVWRNIASSIEDHTTSCLMVMLVLAEDAALQGIVEQVAAMTKDIYHSRPGPLVVDTVTKQLAWLQRIDQVLSSLWASVPQAKGCQTLVRSNMDALRRSLDKQAAWGSVQLVEVDAATQQGVRQELLQMSARLAREQKPAGLLSMYSQYTALANQEKSRFQNINVYAEASGGDSSATLIAEILSFLRHLESNLGGCNKLQVILKLIYKCLALAPLVTPPFRNTTAARALCQAKEVWIEAKNFVPSWQPQVLLRLAEVVNSLQLYIDNNNNRLKK
eukprot:gene3693-94_t